MPVPPPPFKRNRRTTINDARFLIAHGVGLTEAAQRMGFPTRGAMEKWLDNYGFRAEKIQLAAQDWVPLKRLGSQKETRPVHRAEGTAA